MRPANNQTHWQMSAAPNSGLPKALVFHMPSYRRSQLLSDMIFMVIVFHLHLAPGLGDRVINAISF